MDEAIRTTRENYDDYNRTAEAGKCEDEDETLWYSHASKKPSAPDQIYDDAQDNERAQIAEPAIAGERSATTPA
jgi:hypothetical protein